MSARRRWWISGALALLAAGLVVAVIAGGTGGSGSPPRPRGLGATTPTTLAVLPAPARAPGPPATPVPVTPADEAFGADVNRVFENATFTPAQVNAQLSALQGAGATVARTDALWEFTEPAAPDHGRHTYDWAFDDRVAAALAAHGLRWLPIIDYSPAWVQSLPGQDHSPPRSAADYADYAAAFAARYGPGGAFWVAHRELPPLPVAALEVWNEPDNPTFWSPAPDPARYAQLYLQTRDSVAATAPAVRVLIGGLWHAESFMPKLLGAQPALRGHVDGVSLHPYGPTPGAIVARVAQVRGLLTLLGLGPVPLYVTEFGWTTSPPGARDFMAAAQRPANLAQAVIGLARAGCGVAAVVAYTWVTEQVSPSDSEQWYGISNVEGTPTPAAIAFAGAVRVARSLTREAGTCAG